MMRFDLRPGIRRLFRLPFRAAAAIHADADEELESLIAARVDDFVSRGMLPSQARAEALRRLGVHLEIARDQLHHSAELRERHMRLHEHWESLAQDVRYAARGLVRRPGFTVVAVLTLAIGIGATTAIFSAVNVLLLRPLPYARPDELMKVTLTAPPRGTWPARDHVPWSYPKYTAFRDAQHVFSDVALYSASDFSLTGGDVERVSGEYVGASVFRTLGVTPALGRFFDLGVDRPGGAAREVVVSHRLWNRRFNADPTLVGQTIDIDRAPYMIIGVAPRNFSGLSGEAEVFVPITTQPIGNLNQPQMHGFWMVARRAPGVSEEQSVAAVTLLGSRVSDAFPHPMDKLR